MALAQSSQTLIPSEELELTETLVHHDTSSVRFWNSEPERIFTIEPNGPSHSDIVLVHGLTDHPARHFQTALFLAEHGFSTTLFDLAGHGGRAKDFQYSKWIYQGYANNADPAVFNWSLRRQLLKEGNRAEFLSGQYETLLNTTIYDHLDQMDAVLEHLDERRRHQDPRPLFLMGFSMGGLISTETALRYRGKKNFRGLVLISPAFKPKGRPGNLLENLAIDTAWNIRDLPFPLFRQFVKTALEFNFKVDASWGAPYMSDLPAEVELYRSDPLVPTYLPSAYASSIESLMTRTNRCAKEIPSDCLFLFPGDDGITSRVGGLRFARRAQSALGPSRCTILEYEETEAHDLSRSSVRQEALQSILDWMLDRSPGHANS